MNETPAPSPDFAFTTTSPADLLDADLVDNPFVDFDITYTDDEASGPETVHPMCRPNDDSHTKVDIDDEFDPPPDEWQFSNLIARLSRSVRDAILDDRQPGMTYDQALAQAVKIRYSEAQREPTNRAFEE